MSDMLRMAPRFLLQDKDGYAFVCVIEWLDGYLAQKAQEALQTLFDADRMPEWRLDERAWEMNMRWYDYSGSVERKRAQIKGAKDYYRRLGTPYAVERAIEDVYGEGLVEEWFDYGGEPYHFTVATTNTGALLENRAKFERILEYVKNVRSVLDNVTYYGEEGQAQGFVAAAMAGAEGQIFATAINNGGA